MKIKLVSSLFIFGLLVLQGCSSDPAPSISFDEQLRADIAIIDKYLSDNGISATQDASGARYVVSTAGSGPLPLATDTIYASLKATVMGSGVVFLDTKGDFYSIKLTDPILTSWSAVIPKIKRGSTFTIYSPSGLAYGNSTSSDGVIQANSNIIFAMKLYDDKTFNKTEQFKADTTAIEAFLKANSITATIKDASGLRIVVTTPGTGTSPLNSSTISFTYDGKFLNSGVSFDKSTTPVSSPLANLIKGFQIGMPLLKSGARVTFYIPSSLGYGLYGVAGTIPSNANLIFDVQLVSTN